MKAAILAVILATFALTTLAEWRKDTSKDPMSNEMFYGLINERAGSGVNFVHFVKYKGRLSFLVDTFKLSPCSYSPPPCNLRVKFGDDTAQLMTFKTTDDPQTIAVFGADAEKIRAALVAGKTVLVEVGTAIAKLSPKGFDSKFLDK